VKPGKDTFELTRVGSLDEIAHHLTDLAAGLERGEVSLGSGTDAMRLVPPSEIKVDLRVEEKRGRGKLMLEIRWKRPAAALSELTIEVRPAPAPA
jgi:amphi-Trp domain-containing protein